MKKHKILVRSTLVAVGKKIDIRLLRYCIRRALETERVNTACEISVLITDDAGIRKINKEFRDLDVPTDVLSFPMQVLIPGDFKSDQSEISRDTGFLPLGDIVLSVDRIAEQAVQYGQSMNREMVYLTIHSVLHLLGYDHLDEGIDKRIMRAREQIILDSLTLKTASQEEVWLPG